MNHINKLNSNQNSNINHAVILVTRPVLHHVEWIKLGMKFNRFPSPLFSPVFPFLQYPHYKEEMYLQAQRAFGVSPERHYRFLHAAAEEKPKLVVLSVIVYEAEGLEAKDANGN